MVKVQGIVSQKVKINLKFDFYGVQSLKSIVRSILTICEMHPWSHKPEIPGSIPGRLHLIPRLAQVLSFFLDTLYFLQGFFCYPYHYQQYIYPYVYCVNVDIHIVLGLFEKTFKRCDS